VANKMEDKKKAIRMLSHMDPNDWNVFASLLEML